ncbi:MAG: hypothetical protein ACOXZ4_06700 [Sphaerochaetaceae bacterium]
MKKQSAQFIDFSCVQKMVRKGVDTDNTTFHKTAFDGVNRLLPSSISGLTQT